MLLSGALHTPAIETRDSCQASALPPEPHLSMCDTILSLLSRHKHEKTQIRKTKYFLQRLAVGKDDFASGKAGTTEAEALEYDSKMMEKIPLESELDCLREPTRTQQPLSQWSFNFILAEGGSARLASSEKGTKGAFISPGMRSTCTCSPTAVF